MTLSRLHSISHILFALLVPIWWSAALGETPSVGLLVICAWLGLLPDIDSQASTVGRLIPELARQIERYVGHRTLTHSVLMVGVLAGILWLVTPDWLVLALAYASHILLDMIVGGNTGVVLLWPLPARFKLGHINSASRGELILTSGFGLLLILPMLAPTTAAQVQAMIPQQPTPTPTATPRPPVPTLVSLRVDHVIDLEQEIKVRVGQPLAKGQLVADLVYWRATVIASAPPTPTPLRILLPTATLVTPTPYVAPTLDPLVAAAAWNDLQLARARATLAAAPPSIEEIQRCQSTLESMRNALWADQLARDAAKIRANEPGANIPWESIGAMEAKLFDQERAIAEQEVQCTALQQQEHAAGPDQLALAAVQLAKAEIHYAQIVATPPPPATPTPTPTPLPTLSPTPWPTVDTGPSYASSVVSGTVHSVKVVDSDG
ncbi:MAG: metal-dependent hydrolase, partial [Caldilineaceae bacterium]|nr:metal-dependent hydrolase [Caldilineaceae bacterium]